MSLAERTDDATLLVREDRDGVAALTLNRPKQFNALSEALIDALQATFDEIADDRSVRVVTIAGSGRAFCAGHDFKEMRARPEKAYYEALFKKCGLMMTRMLQLPQPVIARVHGIATAAGCQMVANADMAVASTEARFGTSGINYGLFCMTPGVPVSRNVGRKKAFEMLFTGDLVAAEDACAAGLVNRVVAPEALDAEIDALCQSIVSKSAAAVAAGKAFFYRQIEMDLEAAYAGAAEEMARNMMFRDAGEGIDAFLAKRKPVWRHE
jgi:enoyl-CoA hydratase/carnithine racemase